MYVSKTDAERYGYETYAERAEKANGRWAMLGIEKVKLIPDGNGSFTNGIKALVPKENLGFGMRAWRLAMIISADGLVEWVGVEKGQRTNASDDPYEESTPERVLGALTILKANEEAAKAADATAEADALAAVGG